MRSQEGPGAARPMQTYGCDPGHQAAPLEQVGSSQENTGG